MEFRHSDNFHPFDVSGALSHSLSNMAALRSLLCMTRSAVDDALGLVHIAFAIVQEQIDFILRNSFCFS
jgi:hypothetical protein